MPVNTRLQGVERQVDEARLSGPEASALVYVQGHYHACLAKAAPFCGDPDSTHGKHFQAVTGEAMALLSVFSECLPEEFMACQSISMLDGTSQMPQQTFEDLKVSQHCTDVLMALKRPATLQVNSSGNTHKLIPTHLVLFVLLPLSLIHI